MIKNKKILIPFSILLLVFSLVGITRNLLQDYYAQRQLEELTRLLEIPKTESVIGGGGGGRPSLFLMMAISYRRGCGGPPAFFSNGEGE